MPTALSHPAVPLAISIGLGRSAVPSRLVAAGIVASVLPDLDVIAFRFGIPYAAQFGHRGFSHSLAFAALVALLGAGCHRLLRSGPMATFAFLFAATASHGVLDAFTNGGLGVAFFWPFSPTRYFAPIRMIQVAPLTAARLLSHRGAVVLASELLWVGLPCAVLGVVLAISRRRMRAPAARPRVP
jgi:inner membrane protein